MKESAEEVGWSLFPREDGLFDLHQDEKTGPKWVCRGESIYPPCPMEAPEAIWHGERYRAFRQAFESDHPARHCSHCGLNWSY